jgi:peptidoglycan/LPS O-acetylase OafA/YrhL
MESIKSTWERKWKESCLKNQPGRGNGNPQAAFAASEKSTWERKWEPASRFRGFDGVRGIAILLVIIYHGVLASRFPLGQLGLARPLLLAGWTGVDLFFALSGFLITALLIREERSESAAGRPARFSLGKFYLRRACRILPAFYAVFLLDAFVLSRAPFPSVGLSAVRHSSLGLLPFGTFWTNYWVGYGERWFGHGWTFPPAGYLVFWSLCVEEHFYLLWPLLLLLVRSPRARAGMAISVGAALLLLRCLVVAEGWDQLAAVHYASHYRMDSILWGGTAAILSDRLRLPARWHRLLIAVGSAIILTLVLTDTMSVVPLGRPMGFAVGYSILSLTASLVLLDLVARPRSWMARLLEFPMLVRLGKVSYGMYLLHLPMIDLGLIAMFATRRLPTALNLALALSLFVVVAYGAAWLLYHVVERPFLLLKDRYFS